MTLPQPRGFQNAVDECYEDEKTGEFAVGNGEYGNEVRFCPECGAISPAEARRRHEQHLKDGSATIQTPPGLFRG